ncbi:MAG: CBS domain-containing protein [Methanomethylovorans sp.]|uniref:CBS domain-containing protein n=1 Tax=Methanomethylovorans sp. TaxID=2758717 RepID=UPI000B1705C7|nr:CBS domain-containing protein [Methanomethylovorans sp.]
MEVKDIMTEPPTISKSDTLSHALDIMEKKEMRRALVKQGDKIVGILTMRNLTRELGTRKKGNMPASSLHVATAVSDNFVKVFPDVKVKDAVTLIDKNQGVIIVCKDEKVVGWVTPTELLSTDNFNGFAGEFMQKETVIASPGDRVSHIRRLMLDKNVGRIPITENGKLVGIVTEKDVVKAMRAFRDIVSGNQQEARIKNLIVADIMKRSVMTVNTNTSLSDVAKMMLAENIGGLPVLNLEGEFVGFITRRNLVHAMAQ